MWLGVFPVGGSGQQYAAVTKTRTGLGLDWDWTGDGLGAFLILNISEHI